MAHDGQDLGFHLTVSSTIDNLVVKTRRAADELSGLFETARQQMKSQVVVDGKTSGCLLYTSPSPRDKRQSRMPSSA